MNKNKFKKDERKGKDRKGDRYFMLDRAKIP